MKSEEGQEPGAKAAVAKVIASQAERYTRDLSRVRVLPEWMKKDTYSQVFVGHVLVILGMKYSELAKSEWRSGRSAYDIFDEVLNAQSSLTAVWTAMALGLIRRMGASHRDAADAYLQALLDVDPGVVNPDGPPRSWWPRNRLEDDAMTMPKYRRPVAPLVYALPGHPKSGNVWEERAESILVKLGWRKMRAGATC